jgi:hypothetical protein
MGAGPRSPTRAPPASPDGVVLARLQPNGATIGSDPTQAAPALFNVVTIATVLVGVAALYLALVLLSVLGALLLVPSGLLAAQLGHPAGITDQIELAWLASSVATVGGALGAGLETDEAVREAAYGYVPDTELTRA